MNEDQNGRKKYVSVDDLNEQLYYQKEEMGQRERRKIHNPTINLPKEFPDDDFDEWKKKTNRIKLPTSFFKKVFLGVLGFSLITLIVAGIIIYSGKTSVSGDLISMEIVGQTFVDGGENLQLQVRIQNFNQQALELPDLILSYPKDSREGGGERTILRRSLEDITPQDRASEEFNIILFGQEGDVRTIDAKLEYRIDQSNAIFVKDASYDVIIRSTPSVIAVNAPREIVRGQLFEMDIDISSNSTTVVNNTLLDIEYPGGFEFISADPAPSMFNNIWAIPILADEKQTITVRGRLAALEGQGQSFGVNFGKRNNQRQGEIETLFNRLVHTVDVSKPFIMTDLVLNGSDDPTVTIRGGGEINGEIRISNTLSDVLQDVVITLNVAGSLYDPTGIRAENGFFNSNTRTLSWDKTTLQNLALLQPGEERTLSFNLPTQDLVGDFGPIKEPELDLVVDIAAVEINGTVREAQTVSRATVVANSDIQVVATALHQEGPFQNYGPMPPRMNQATSYTVTLEVTNSSNTVEDGKINFFLPAYATWKNALSPSVERSSVTYNETTREVVWNLGTLRAGLGTIGNPSRELSFQVEILPSSSQLGDQVRLTSDIVLTGTDAFTDARLSFKKTALENRIIGSTEPGNDGRIAQ